jgi:hypothetical protein
MTKTKINPAIQAQEFQALYDHAQREGFKTGDQMIPRPMTLVNADILGNVKPNSPTYYVSEGMCGFAWVVIKPATSAFAKWLVKNKLARKGYYGGIHIWIGAHDQSYERKAAHANAMALVLSKAGYDAYADGRLD